PARVHGKVIFCDPSEGACNDPNHNPWVCSGTVINTTNRSVVITAGHCVYNNETKTWMQNWSFYPGYKRGKHPRYGVWPSRDLWVCEARQGRRSRASEGAGPNPYAVGCDMLGGSSGGGWVENYSDRLGWGKVFSVNSSGPDDKPLMYGPVFGRRALSLIDDA